MREHPPSESDGEFPPTYSRAKLESDLTPASVHGAPVTFASPSPGGPETCMDAGSGRRLDVRMKARGGNRRHTERVLVEDRVTFARVNTVP